MVDKSEWHKHCQQDSWDLNLNPISNSKLHTARESCRVSPWLFACHKSENNDSHRCWLLVFWRRCQCWKARADIKNKQKKQCHADVLSIYLHMYLFDVKYERVWGIVHTALLAWSDNSPWWKFTPWDFPDVMYYFSVSTSVWSLGWFSRTNTQTSQHYENLKLDILK